MLNQSRRRFLQVCATSMIPFAGCTADEPPTTDAQPSAPDSATPMITGAPTETARPTSEPRVAEAWSVDTLAGKAHTLMLPEVSPAEDPAGPLYAVTAANEIAKIDPESGRVAWTKAARGEEGANPPLTPIEDAVFAISETFDDERLLTHVEALDPDTGDSRWAFEDRFFLEVLGVVDDIVVLSGEYIEVHPDEIGPERSPAGDGRLFGLDLSSGEQQWVVDVPVLRGAAVARHGAYALEFVDHETHLQTLHAIDLDGSERWSVETGSINPGSPVATEELLLAGVGDGTDAGGVGRYDPGDGSLRWRSGHWARGPGDIAVDGDTIHAGKHPFLALDPDGEKRYQANRFGFPEAPATPETLYTDGGSRIQALDRASGEVRWQYRPKDYKYTHARAVLADQIAVDRGIGPDQEVVLIRESDGTVAGTFQTPGNYFGAVGAGPWLFLGVESEVVAYDVTIGGR